MRRLLLLVGLLLALATPASAAPTFPAPTGLKVTGTQTDGVFLDWDDYTAFGEDGYLIELHDANGALLDTKDQTIAANSDWWWNGLRPDTTYQFRVRAYDTQTGGSRVYSDWTSLVSAQTDPVGPPPPPPDTTPPTVSLTAPSDGATVSGSQTVTANASDNVGIAGVQFKVDGANVGSEDTTSPYSATWDTTGVSNGTHTLTAVARDSAGNTTTSSSMTVTVNNAPTSCPNGQYLSTYWPNQTLTGPSSLTRCETVVQNDWGPGGPPGLPTDHFSARYDGNINFDAAPYTFDVIADDGVRVWVDSVLFIDEWKDQAATLYEATKTMTAGLHDVKIEYYENGGDAEVWFTTTKQTPPPDTTTPPPPPDTTPPIVSLTAPSDGATAQGATTLSANASDDTAVDDISFRVDGHTVNTDSTAPYSYSWDSTTVPDGSHSITALAVDTAGNSTPSSAANVNVRNAPAPRCSNPPCWDFAGNSFNGANYNEVPSTAMDLAVAPDGVAVTGADWVESAHDVRAYTTTGQPVGPRPGNSSGRFRENGGGPFAVAATSTGIYAAQARNIVRWDKTTFVGANAGSTYNGTTLAIPGSGSLVGLTACGSDVYVTDAGTTIGEQGVSPDNAQVKDVNGNLSGGVIRQWTVPRARKLACDRQGNLWVLGQKTSTASAHLYRYSPAGTQLASWDVSGDPMDVAADPTSDQVLVADNGPDQDIERYDYSGNLVSRIGVQGGYLAGPTPGLLDRDRFAGPRGVDLDSSGNVYVLQTLNPNRGIRAWNEDAGQVIVSKLTPSGTESYRVWGQAGMPGMMSDDGTRFYNGDITYARSNGVWKPYAMNMDGFSGSDPEMNAANLQLATVTRTTEEREVSGHRLLVQSGSSSEFLRIYRFDGELRRICQQFPGNPKDLYMAPNGDVWRVDHQATHYKLTGWDASGCPTYDGGTTMAAAPGVSDAYRIAVDGTTVYLMGYNSDFPFESGFDDWKFSGKVVARYDNVTGSTWPNATWRTAVQWNAYPDRPVSMDASRNRLAVAYLAGGAGVGQGHIRVFNSADGSLLADLVPPTSLFGPMYGWDDLFGSITVKNGLISSEANGQDKTILITPP